MHKIYALLLAGVVAGCTTAPEPVERTAQAEAELQRLLAGRVAGQPVSCIPRGRADRMVVIDDRTVVFNDGGRVYRNELVGECNRLSSGFYTLLTRSSTSSMCRGEIAQVVDPTTGMTVGSCAIGDFVPYARP